MLNRLKNIVSLGRYQSDQSDWPPSAELLFRVGILAGCFFHHVFPSLATMMGYLVLHRNYCLINCWQDKIRFEELRDRTFRTEFQKTIDRVKRANLLISPLLFILISYWLTAIFYNSSKLIYIAVFKDISSYLSVVFNTTSYSTQFVILLALASKIPMAVCEIKRAVVRTSNAQDYVFIDNARSGDINLFISMLDSFKEEVTVAPFEILTLKKGIILDLGLRINLAIPFAPNCEPQDSPQRPLGELGEVVHYHPPG
ncbi:hypothetical protein TNCV_381311 [Trichonephila clavipes]|uniref:Uncharacterized protein n=1 Tax=Trichonephila clavipes TaxID=2585209 RepID=A0A8X6SJM0_TRICX|nr:hypothetical protein TNCV_381311 [Trichonephila clavipes]